jgi:hypothetical protein
MKRLFTLCMVAISFAVLNAKPVATKTIFFTAGSKSYTGFITTVQREKCNVKCEGIDSNTSLMESWVAVTEQSIPAATTDTLPELPGNPEAGTGNGQTTGAMPVQGTAQMPSQSMTAGDSLKMAFTNLKTAFADVNKLFARKSDTMLIVIPQVEYDNGSVTQLKDNLKKLKGVRSVTMRYSAATATLQVAYKGKPTDVWDTLPTDVKAGFKLTELGDAGITLQCKQKTF